MQPQRNLKKTQKRENDIDDNSKCKQTKDALEEREKRRLLNRKDKNIKKNTHMNT